MTSSTSTSRTRRLADDLRAAVLAKEAAIEALGGRIVIQVYPRSDNRFEIKIQQPRLPVTL